MVLRLLCALLATAVCIGCGLEPKPRFEDPAQIKIADFQDRRMTDSLLPYLASDNMWHQRAAALGLGSVQDTSFIAMLWKTQIDHSAMPDVVFALGQTNSEAAVKLLSRYADNFVYKGDHLEEDVAFEALGKVVTQKSLDLFKRPKEGFYLSEGITWGIYRAGIRGITDSERIDIAALALGDEGVSNSARLGAAHFFSRANFTPTPTVVAALVKGAADRDVEVRLAATGALAKLKPEESLESLTARIDDPDYRVRVNAARALRMQPWDIAKPLYAKLLKDSNAHVSVAAAEVIITISKDTTFLANWAAMTKNNWRAQAILMESLVKTVPAYSKEVQSLYENSNNPYQKAAAITALSQGDNAEFIFDQFKATDVKVIKSTAASAIARINRRQVNQSLKFVDFYKEILKDGDQGAIIYVCGALSDTTLGFKKIITDYSFLEEAKSKLSLPRDYETYEPLERTLNYFKDLPPPPPLKNEYNHPIDWKLAATIKKDQKVVVETTKGKITMQLFIEEAPGSVVNFVKLVNDKYYDGKYFHRVVPNFVIQTGCDRGDGFGSLDYSIRSEFSRRKYKTGSVGMASAGKDTEGTQWFITHSPTPHLDGKYTIFAEVTEGMDVVHQIEVGDQIISAHLAD